MFDNDLKIRYSRFRGLLSTEPVLQEKTVQEMGDFFTPHFPALVEKEERTELFSMNIYQDNTKRASKNVFAMTGLVFDFDNKKEFLPIMEILNRLDQKMLIYFWYTTYSHTPERPKWRLIIPFASPLLPSNWEDVYEHALVLMGMPPGIDHAASKDIARMWYIPYTHTNHQFMGGSCQEGWLVDPLDLHLLLTSEEKEQIALKKEKEIEKEKVYFDYKNDVSLDQIEKALYYINAGCSYEEWIRVGMALHDQLGGEGFSLWRKWSEKSAKFPGIKILKKHWESLEEKNKDKKITIGTLFHYAKQGGYITSFQGELPVIASSEIMETSEDALDPFSVFDTYEKVDIYKFPSQLLNEIYTYLLKRHSYDVPVYAMGGAIALAGFLLRDKIQSLTRLRTNFMVLAIGGSGTGKTMIRNGVLEILKYVGQNNLYAQRLGSYQGSVERLEKNKGCMFLIQDEARFELTANRNKNANNSEIRVEEFKLTIFSCPPYYSPDIIKGSEPVIIENPFFSEFSISTPDMLKCFSPDDVTKGLLPRYFLFTTEKVFFEENKHLDYEMSGTFKSLLDEFKFNRSSVSHQALLNKEAYTFFEGFKKYVQDCRRKILTSSILDEHARFDAVLARLPEHAIKLSLLGGVKTKIGYELTYDAIAWGIGIAVHSFKNLIYTIRHNLYENKTEEYHRRVLEIIRALSSGKWVRRRQVLRKTQFLRGRELEEILLRLRDEEAIEMKQTQDRANVILIRSIEKGEKND